MLQSRLIPVLTLSNNALVITKKFKVNKYIGDPINTIRILNEKKVDEIAFIDIDATTGNLPPNFKLIERIARECRSPISYGGGIKCLEEIEKIVSIGVEKVIISKSFFDSKGEICKHASKKLGSQSVVVCFDVHRNRLYPKRHHIYTSNGTCKESIDLPSALKLAEKCGVGEIIINSINQDGTRGGYDHTLAKLVYDATNVPVIITGGASSFDEASDLTKSYPGFAAAGSTIFMLKGKFDAVLVQYPEIQERKNNTSSLSNQLRKEK